MGRVSDKVALVTGGATGLGAAHAAALGREGARVVVTDIDRDGGAAVAAAIPNAVFATLDVRDEAQWIQVLDMVRRDFGRLDILVNNAGVVRFATIEECTLDDYRFVNAVSAEGTFLGCKHAIPLMAEGGGGVIVNTASLAAIRARTVVPAYSAAKGAVVSLSRSVAAYCKERGYNIRCNAILPGAHETALAAEARKILPSIPGEAGEWIAQVKRGPVAGKPEDAANLVVFLCCEESRGINGASIVIDNGQLLVN